MDTVQANIALFPLNTVVFPGGHLPLRVFEVRYIDMVRDCLRRERPFVVVATHVGERHWAEDPFRANQSELPGDRPSDTPRAWNPDTGFADTGTLTHIRSADHRADGLLGIDCIGDRRVRIERVWQQRDGLWIGDVRDAPEHPDIAVPLEHLALQDLAERLLSSLGGDWLGLRATLRGPDQGAHAVVGRLAELLPLELDDKQSLFVLDDPIERLEALQALLLGSQNEAGG